MTPADIRRWADQEEADDNDELAKRCRAFAELVEAAERRDHGNGYNIKSEHDPQDCSICEALARVEAL